MGINNSRERITEVVNYIHENLDSSLTLRELSGIAFLSPSHFKKIFRETSGENISDYVKRVRLEKAQYMLLHNQYRSITEIAMDTGFSSSASFARAFRQYFGISASDFRKDNSNEAFINFGTPYLKNVTPHEYDGYESVYAITDDGNGTFYFGSDFGEIYIYSRNDFKKICIHELSPILSLSFDEKGTLWVGSVGDMGYIETGPDSFEFISIKGRLPDSDRDFSHVWQIVPSMDGIYFQTRSAIFRWHNEKFSVIRTGTSFHSLTAIYNKIYLLEFRQGLMSIKGDKLLREPGADQVNAEHLAVCNFLPYDYENIFCLTRNKGCWLYNGKEFRKFHTEIDHLFDEAGILRGVFIPGLGYAIGTRTMGILIIDNDGKLFCSINSSRGLMDNYIRAVHYTKDEMLLVGMNFGIAMSKATLPVMIFRENTGIRNMVASIIKHRGTLYLATQYGIVKERHNHRGGEELFQRIPDIITQTHDLIESNECLCIAYGFGLYIIGEDCCQDFNLDIPIRSLCRSNVHEGKLYGASNSCVFCFYFYSGKWNKGETIGKLEGSLYRVVEDSKGRIFTNSSNGMVYRVSFNCKNSPEIKSYGAAEGIPRTPTSLFKIKNKIYAATQNGVLCYDEETEKFTDDNFMGGFFRNRLVHEIVEDGEDIWAIEGRSRNVYFIKNTHGVSYNPPKPFLSSPDLRATAIYPEGNGIVWIGCSNKLVRCDVRDLKKNRRHQAEQT